MVKLLCCQCSPLITFRGIYKGCLRGAKSLFLISFPLSFEGEGDKGGEVERKGVYQCFSSHPPLEARLLRQTYGSLAVK